MADIAYFPTWRGTIIEISDARIIFESDGTETPGFAVDVRNHPKLGDIHIWHGLTFYLAQMQAEEMLSLLPGAEIEIVCDEPDDDGDDPGGGQDLTLADAA